MGNIMRKAVSRQDLKVAMVWVLIYVVFRLIAPKIDIKPASLAMFVSVLLTVLLSMLIVKSVTRIKAAPKFLVVLLLIFGLLFGGLVFLKFLILADLMLMFSSIFLGCLIAGLVRERNMLPAVALVAGIMDIWGVYLGPTHEVVKAAPQVVHTLSVKTPLMGSAKFISTIGLGDIFFLALFFRCAYEFGLNLKRTFWVAFGLLLVGLLVVSYLGIDLPALVLIAIAVVVANWGYFRLTRAEKFALVYVTGLILVIVGILAVLKLRF